jgi:hypothetical protein
LALLVGVGQVDWVHKNLPNSACANAIANLDPNLDVCTNSGLFRSVDIGLAWTSVSLGLTSCVVKANVGMAKSNQIAMR